MRQLILSNEGVLALDLLRTRLFGSKMYVEVEIEADRDLPLYEAKAGRAKYNCIR